MYETRWDSDELVKVNVRISLRDLGTAINSPGVVQEAGQVVLKSINLVDGTLVCVGIWNKVDCHLVDLRERYGRIAGGHGRYHEVGRCS